MGKRCKYTADKGWRAFKGSALEFLWASHTPDHNQTADARSCGHKSALAQSDADKDVTQLADACGHKRAADAAAHQSAAAMWAAKKNTDDSSGSPSHAQTAARIPADDS